MRTGPIKKKPSRKLRDKLMSTATIKDVALRAHVSIGTVSNVLNNVATVSDPIRQRVRRAIAALNYKPNRLAKGLVSGRSHSLAFIIPDITNPFFPEMVRGASERAASEGYSIFLGNVGPHSNQELEYIHHFMAQGVDGLILAASEYSTYVAAEMIELNNLRIPLVMVDRSLEGLQRDLVIVDNVACAGMAVNHLMETGRRRIALLMGPAVTMTARERLAGGRQALERRKLFRPELVRNGPYSLEGGRRMMRELLDSGQAFDGVFAGNDMIAMGALKQLEQAGRTVPDQVALVGFDDLYLSSLIRPALTSVRQPTAELGAHAVRLIIERLTGTEGAMPRKIILPGELMIRETT